MSEEIFEGKSRALRHEAPPFSLFGKGGRSHDQTGVYIPAMSGRRDGQYVQEQIRDIN